MSSTASGGSLALYGGIDAIGDRLSTGISSAFGYLVPDLHGNVVAVATSTGSWTTAYRYDPYGETVDVCSGSITSLWRFQGRILESAEGSTDLYDFSARSYDPSLGAFTSFDSVSGSAQNPLTLNRYLYANANPATMIDPDGHCAALDNWSGCESGGADDFQNAKRNSWNPALCASSRGQYGCGSTASVTPSSTYTTGTANAKYGPPVPKKVGSIASSTGVGANLDPGMCNEGFFGCLRNGVWDFVTSPVTLAQCGVDEQCRNALINHLGPSNPDFFSCGLTTPGPVCILAHDMVNQHLDALARGDADDLAYLGAQDILSLLGLKGLGKGATAADDAAAATKAADAAADTAKAADIAADVVGTGRPAGSTAAGAADVATGSSRFEILGNGKWIPPKGFKTNTSSIRALARSMGLNPDAVMKYIERVVKPDWKLGAKDNVSVGPDGKIYAPDGTYIGDIGDAPAIRR